MAIYAEQIAVTAMREYLLRKWATYASSVFSTKYAVLKSSNTGPAPLASGDKLSLSADNETFTEVTLTGNGHAAIASDINTAAPPGLEAGVDANGLLYIKNTTALTQDGFAGVFLGPAVGASTVNRQFGWSLGGESIVLGLPGGDLYGTSYLSQVVDGWPDSPLFDSGVNVIIGDRSSVPAANSRQDTYEVDLEVVVLVAPPVHGANVRNRDAIHSCVRVVREAILADRTLGCYAAGTQVLGGVQMTWETSCRIPGQPYEFEVEGKNLPPMDAAFMNWKVRVYERQS